MGKAAKDKRTGTTSVQCWRCSKWFETRQGLAVHDKWCLERCRRHAEMKREPMKESP